ncbi:MAG: lipoate--protein ligase family protein [DPANN group archaeon]|nr:lipoate--protein ligase family protein [DPANN group archaeon]
MRYRLIRQRSFPAAMNMALDEAIAESVKAGRSLPTIRFYGWEPSAISIGYFQSLENEVDLEACRKAGVEWVRRRTGGGAVYHDASGEITYSIIGPEEHFPRDILKSYEQVCGILIRGLERLGMAARFSPINDVLVDGKKISGNAQTRRHGILLQHGTLLYAVDVKRMFALLKVSKEKISDKLIQSVKKRVTSISQHTAASKEEVLRALEAAFGDGRDTEIGDYTAEELARAGELVKEKYATRSWNALR